ncbi:MAG: ABC transporter substrate-binding protein [Thermodesulfobacteriota bacterium]|nr:ABC transporter substrate-binding protein [Thermodesulfobacteriota bacterium]
MEKRYFDVYCYFLLFFVPLISVLLFWSVKIGYAQEVRGVTDTTIKIGAILDQTGPAAGDITLPAAEAVRNYTKEINNRGGIHGRKIKLLIEDDRYSIPVGIAAFKKLLFKDRIFALFGPGSTGEAKALFKHIQKLKIPNLTGAPDGAQIKPLKRYIFMPFNLYDDQLGVIFDYIVNDLQPKRIDVTFVYFDAESGKVALASARKWAEHFNFNLTTEVLNMGALDAASQVLSIKRKNPTHIVIHHGSPGTVALLRDLKKFGLEIPVFGDMISCFEDTVRMGGDASKNYFGASVVSSWYENYEGVKKLREITLKYHPGTESPYRSKMYTLGWLVGIILYEGIKRAGKDLNAEGLLEAWESLRDMDTEGISGLVTFTPTNHKGIHYTKLYKTEPQSGVLVPITDWRKTPERR